MAVTTYDIARKVGATQATVSRALRNDVSVAATTRVRIQAEAKRMGYKPNLLARALVRGKTDAIGFLFGSFHLDVAAAKLIAFENLAAVSGYRLYISHYHEDIFGLIDLGNELVARGVDGLVVYGQWPQTLEALNSFQVPTVFMDSQLPFSCKQVYQDKAVGVRQAVDYLYQLGHRRMYMLRGNWRGWESDRRFTGFQEGIEVLGLADGREHIHQVEQRRTKNENGQVLFDVNDVCGATRSFLKSYPDCTAIFCSSDDLACTVLLTLARLGIKVPDDISVVGFDNIPATTFSQPPLTTVTQPVGKVVGAAFTMLLDAIKNDKPDNDKPETVVIPTELMLRESTGPVRSKLILDI